jgi:tetratricopeptide (TPR) repeat protein
MEDLNIKTIIEKSDELLLEAICEDDETKRTELLADARLQLTDALTRYPENADLHHMLGLCWYWDDQDSKNGKPGAEQAFKSALEFKSTHQFANLYLGHVYFDTGKYDAALNLFSKADANYFESLEQHWRNIKNAELILCCRLYLKLDDVGLAEIEDLCRLYESADDIDAPLPLEIIVCVAKLIEKNPDKLKPMAFRLVKMVQQIGVENAKPLQKDLVYLKTILT